MYLKSIHHVQLAMPEGKEDEARRFYRDVLNLTEVAKPAHLSARGGVWFERGSLRVHLGVEKDFAPARKAHPAFLVTGLDALIVILKESGFRPAADEPLEGFDRVYVNDPFGNRIELMQPSG